MEKTELKPKTLYSFPSWAPTIALCVPGKFLQGNMPSSAIVAVYGNSTVCNTDHVKATMRVILGFDTHEVDGLLTSLLERVREDGATATIVHLDDKKETEDAPPKTAEGAAAADAGAEASAVTAASVGSDTNEELEINLTEDGVRKLYEEILECSITMQVIFLASFDKICYLRLSDGEYMSPVVTIVIKPELKKVLNGAVIEVKETRLETSNSHKKRYSEEGSFLRDQVLLHLVITDYSVVAERHQIRCLLGSLDTSLPYKATLAHVAPILKKRNPHFRFNERNSLRDKVRANKIFTQGSIYFGMQRLERAVETYEEAKTVYPYDHRFWYNSSRAFYEMDAFERSEEESVGALKMNPFEMRLYAGAGHAALSQGKHEEALEYAFSGHFICGEADDYFNLMCEVQKKIGEERGEKDYDYKEAVVERFIKAIYGDRKLVDASRVSFMETNERRRATQREERLKQEKKEDQHRNKNDMADGDSRMQGETPEGNKRSKNLYRETLKEARRSYETNAFSQALEKFGRALAYASPIGDSTAINGYSGHQEIQELQFLVAACRIHAEIKIIEGMNTMNFFLNDDNAVGAYASAHYFLGVAYKKICIGRYMVEESLKCSSALSNQNHKTLKWPESNDIFPESDPEQLKILNEELYNDGEYSFEPGKSFKLWAYLPIENRIPREVGEKFEYKAVLEHMEKVVKENVVGLRQQGNLIGRPADIKPIPRAVCQFANCIPGKEKIYVTNPDFNGFVDILCEELCISTYHLSCWEASKRTEEYAGKNSDKDFLGLKCFAPDCSGKIDGILFHDASGSLRHEIDANTGGKQNSASGAKQKKKKKKKKKSKQTKLQEVKDTDDSKCENIPEDLKHIEETATNSWDADGDESQCSNDHQNDTEEKAQVPVSPVPIEPENSDQVPVVMEPSVEEDNWTLKNYSKKKKSKKQKEVIELDLGSPLDADDSNQSEYAARLRLLKQQKEANETDEKNIPKSKGNNFPPVHPLDRSHLLDPENPFYMPQHLRDNPEELEKVLQTKKITSSSSGLGNYTNTPLLNDGRKGKKRTHLDETKGSCSSPSATSLHANSRGSSRSSRSTANPTKSTRKTQQKNPARVDSNSYSTETKTKDISVNDDSHSSGPPKDLMDRVPDSSPVESTPENGHESQSSNNPKEENKREEKSEDNTGTDHDDNHEVEKPMQELVVQKDVDASPKSIPSTSRSSEDDTHEVEKPEQISDVQKNVDGSPKTIASTSQGGNDDTHEVEEPALKSVVQKATDDSLDTIVTNSQIGDDGTKKVEEPGQESDVQKVSDDGPNTIAIDSQRHEVKTSKKKKRKKILEDSPSQPCQSQNDQYFVEDGQEDEEIEEICDAEEESKEAILTEEPGIEKDSTVRLIEENQKLKDEMNRMKEKKDLEIRSLKQNIDEEKAEKRELESEKKSLTTEMEREVRKFQGEISEMQEEIKACQNHRVTLEQKYESSIHRIDELNSKLIKEQELSTKLGDEVYFLKDSLSTSYRCAQEFEIKYLCVKRDLAESFLNRTIDRLTSEVVHLENLLQYASEDSVPDLATISRTIEEWDVHIRTLQGQRSQFLEEANYLMNLVTQREPLNTQPQQDLLIPDIPNISIVPLFTVAPSSKKQLVQPSAPEYHTVPVTVTGPSTYVGGAIPKGTIVLNPRPVVITESGAAAASTYPDTHRIFVGRIPRECTELDIKRAFSDLFGEVVGVTLYDKGVSYKGKAIPKYGFVTFYNAEDQEKALNYGPLMIGNCELKIQEKKPKYPANTSNLAVEGSSTDGSRYEGNKSVECIPKISAKPSLQPLVSGNPAGISGTTSPSKQVWSQLGKPTNGKGGAQPVAVTTATSGDEEIAAYKRLITKCKQHMGKEYSSPEICSALREVRMNTSNNFSEMSVDNIVESVKQHLRARKLATP